VKEASVFCGVVALAANVVVLAKEPVPVCDIEAQENQIERGACAVRLYKQVDDELNLLYKKQLEYEMSFSKWDKERGVPDSAEQFRAAQRAWIEYRDKSCAYENPPAPPGTSPGSNAGESMHRCLEHYTKERVRRLEEYVECQSINGPCP
jgi:uncharacterized protein YecT (DUF1311 family)